MTESPAPANGARHPRTKPRRQYVRFQFFQIDPAWRRLNDARRAADAAEFTAAVAQFQGRMLLRPYSLVGLRGDADFLLWQVTEDLGILREFSTTINRTTLAHYLTMPHAFLSMTRRSIYEIRDAAGDEHADRTIIAPGPAKYLFVYPFVKTRPWYALNKDERQALMDEHIRVGRQYPNVKINTTYSYGLDDQEFVVAFETDDPPSFLDLVAELRETQASLYTQRDTPMFTCEALDLPAIFQALGAPGAARAASPPVAAATASAAATGAERWTTVATADELPPGASKLVYVGGEGVALWNVDGQVYAIANRCTHARGSLCDGTLDGTTVICPWHGGQFDLRTGAAIGGPARIAEPTFRVRRLDDGAIQLATPAPAAPDAPTTAGETSAAPHPGDDLDAVDRKLLNRLQWDFPLVERPFAALATSIAAELDQDGAGQPLAEADIMARVERLRQRTVIRQLSAIFDTRKIGYTSSLVAVHVPADRLDEVALIINEHPGVSHNYRRDNHFNLWFTLAVPPGEDLDAALAALARRAGVDAVRKLPNLRMYKIAVKLDMERDERSIARKDDAPHYDKHPRALTERDREVIRAVQDDIPTAAEFFAGPAAAAGMTVPELFAWMDEMQRLGYLRRFAAILRHQEAGFTANGMITWQVPEERVDEVGFRAAAFPQVSHCYRRPVYPDWPYNVFSMVHARSRAACEDIARQMAADLDVSEYIILYSTHEYKKTRVEYFVREWDDWSLANGEGPAWRRLDERIAAGEFAHGPTTWRERQALMPGR